MASEIGIPVPTRACDSIWNSQQKPTENIVSFFVVHLGFSEVYKSCPSNLVWSGVAWFNEDSSTGFTFCFRATMVSPELDGRVLAF